MRPTPHQIQKLDHLKRILGVPVTVPDTRQPISSSGHWSRVAQHAVNGARYRPGKLKAAPKRSGKWMNEDLRKRYGGW